MNNLTFFIIYNPDIDSNENKNTLNICIENVQKYYENEKIVLITKNENDIYVSTIQYKNVSVYYTYNNYMDPFSIMHLVINTCETKNYIIIKYNMILKKRLQVGLFNKLLTGLYHTDDNTKYDIDDLLNLSNYENDKKELIKEYSSKLTKTNNPFPIYNCLYCGVLNYLQKYSHDLGVYTEKLADFNRIYNENNKKIDSYFANTSFISLVYTYYSVSRNKISMNGIYDEINLECIDSFSILDAIKEDTSNTYFINFKV